MTEPARRRIDVSADTHAWLDHEARRRGLGIRDLVEAIVQEHAGRRGDRQNANEQASKARDDALTGRLRGVIERFDALVARLTEELPTSIADGFDAIKDTIVKTGGTGHLRLMLREQDMAHAARLDAMEAANETARHLAGRQHASAFETLQTGLAAKIDALTVQVATLRDWHKGRRWAAAMGAGGMALMIIAFGLLLADTAPTRWLAIRLTGNTRAMDAAFTLTGGDHATGALMAETKGLLGDPAFRNDYTRCVDHAREARQRFSCRLSVPPIKPIIP